MIDFTHYIKAKSVADTYLQHINYLNGTLKKQHFLTRLSRCQGYESTLADNRVKSHVFEPVEKDLKRKLEMSFDEIWNESMTNDEHGYKKKIKEYDNPDIKFYFGMTEIIGDVCILLRNDINIPDGIEKKINRKNLLKMIDIANDDVVIREDEGTTYVNGIGGIMCLKRLKNSFVPIDWSIINKCYKNIWNFYIEKIQPATDSTMGGQKWLKSTHKTHNYIYGLTHCIINLTNFYTTFIGNNEEWMDMIKITRQLLTNLVDSQKRFNYNVFNDDTLAEMLLVIKLCGGDGCIERIAALDALSLRFDSQKLMFCQHECQTLKEEILKNEHTNILYILNIFF